MAWTPGASLSGPMPGVVSEEQVARRLNRADAPAAAGPRERVHRTRPTGQLARRPTWESACSRHRAETATAECTPCLRKLAGVRS
jgi:hypothetical protein